MHSRTLYAGSAVAGVFGATGIVLLDLAQIFGDLPRQTVGLIEIPITAFLLLALPGVYLWQSSKAGVLGVTGFVLTFVGVALGMGHFYLMAFARSVLTEWPDAAKAVGDAARMVAPFELLTFVGGWVLFGVATYRARVYPRPAAAMLVIGVVLVLIRPLLPVEGPVGGALIGGGMLWLSITLLREARRAPLQRPAPDATRT